MDQENLCYMAKVNFSNFIFCEFVHYLWTASKFTKNMLSPTIRLSVNVCNNCDSFVTKVNSINFIFCEFMHYLWIARKFTKNISSLTIRRSVNVFINHDSFMAKVNSIHFIFLQNHALSLKCQQVEFNHQGTFTFAFNSN